MPRVTHEELQELLRTKLIKYDVPNNIASDCAQLLVENSLDGIYSHGVNRFPRLISYLKKGYVKPGNTPAKVSAWGALEQWDGRLGMGNTNAKFCMHRAVELAKQHGIGCVALANTNHWMRGGSYGIQAAKAGCASICWTNTQPNMPAWGSKERRIGNNPLILCVPRGDDFVLCDAAMSQFSYGSIEAARMAGRQLPVPGGFDENGNATCNPADIEKTWRVMPIGYWKGSGFSILLDMMAAAFSNGNTTADVGRLTDDEYALSQVFIAINLADITQNSQRIVDSIVEDVRASQPVAEGEQVLYPSEREAQIRADNLQNGIPVTEEVWQQISEF